MAAAKAAVDGQVPPGTPHVADVLAFVTPGTDAHRVTALAANRTYGNAPGQSSYGLPFVPENLGAGSVYKIFTAATALQEGVAGIDTVIDVPPSGYLSPIYKDGSGHPVPGAQRGGGPGAAALADRRARPVAQHGVREAGGEHRASRPSSTWRSGSG